MLKVSEVLAERVQKAFPARPTRPMAQRVISGLSVHRLTTGGDIYVPVGPTAAELRDTLCLYQPGIEEMGGDPADDLLTAVQTTCGDRQDGQRPVHFQGCRTPSSTYLDLKKDVDYDAQIEKRRGPVGRRAGPRLLRRHQAVDGTHRREHLRHGSPDLAVPDRVAGPPRRPQWLPVLRGPERSPHGPAGARLLRLLHPAVRATRVSATRTKSDEVFFRSKAWTTPSGATCPSTRPHRTFASTASGGAKAIYLDKANDALRDMSKWLQEKQMTAYEVTYQGKTKTLQDWTRASRSATSCAWGSDERANFRDIVNVISGLALNQQFADIGARIPDFSMLVTESNRKQLVGNALKALAAAPHQGHNAILDALECWTATASRPGRSRYSQEKS